MKQLGNQDAGFIYAESYNTPMHMAGLGIYEQPSSTGGRPDHKPIIHYIQERIHLAPILRQKLFEVPLNIDKPYWVDDPDFDIEFHINHLALPKPGDWRQLCSMISRLNSRPLDFKHPLWEAYIIEGLDKIEAMPKGSFAIFVKVHHALVDGTSGQSIFAALHDLSPDATPPPPEQALTENFKPDAIDLLSKSLTNNLYSSIEQTRGLLHKAPAMLKSAIKLYRKESDSGGRLRIPKTRFNVSISPHRVFEGTYFSLDDIQWIRNTVKHNCTVNDVMLCIVSGALRRYLLEHNELPAASLCAMLPQNIRDNDDKTIVGNRVGGIFTDLHTDIENPLERLLALQKSTCSAKKTAKELNTAALVQNFTGGFLNPCLGKKFNRFLQSSRLIERLGPFAANTVITNVPGPDFPLFHAGTKMVNYWGIPPLMDCLGLGHALFSYCGRITLTVTACRDMLPDRQFYIRCCEESFIELMASTRLLEQKTCADITHNQPIEKNPEKLKSHTEEAGLCEKKAAGSMPLT